MRAQIMAAVLLLAGCAAPGDAGPAERSEPEDTEGPLAVVTTDGPAWVAWQTPPGGAERVLVIEYAETHEDAFVAIAAAPGLRNGTTLGARSAATLAFHGHTSELPTELDERPPSELTDVVLMTNVPVQVTIVESAEDRTPMSRDLRWGPLDITQHVVVGASPVEPIIFERTKAGLDGLLIVYEWDYGAGAYRNNQIYQFPDGTRTEQPLVRGPGVSYAGAYAVATGQSMDPRDTFVRWLDGFSTQQPAEPGVLEMVDSLGVGTGFRIYHLAGADPFDAQP